MFDTHVYWNYILIFYLCRNISLYHNVKKNQLLSRVYSLHSQIFASFGIGSYGFINPIHNLPFTNFTGTRTQYSAILLGSCCSLIKSFRMDYKLNPEDVKTVLGQHYILHVYLTHMSQQYHPVTEPVSHLFWIRGMRIRLNYPMSL
jgi:hypothetical protein